MPRIMVAEDDRKQAEIIRRYLVRDGHEATVVHDGQAAIDQARRRAPDLLVLDLMLPSVHGLDVCRALSGIPVIMLTARTSEDDLLLGLSAGADDYLTKPYRPRELLARIQAMLRRAARAAPERYEVGDLVVDLARRQVTVAGASVDMTPAEFTILTRLAAAPGRAFTRQLLLEHTGGFDRDVTGRAIDMHVLNLRRKIEPVPTRPRYLLTVYGVGYKLAEEARGAS